MGNLDLDAIEARANAATPGPWYVEEAGGTGWYFGWYVERDGKRLEGMEGAFDRQEDAEFAAAARQDVPALIAEVRRLRAAAWPILKALQTRAHSGPLDKPLMGINDGIFVRPSNSAIEALDRALNTEEGQ